MTILLSCVICLSVIVFSVQAGQEFLYDTCDRRAVLAGLLLAASIGFRNKHSSNTLDFSSAYKRVDRDPLDRQAKIVATLGPASKSIEVLAKLIKAGVNVFRLNFSHRRPGEMEELIPNIRRLAKEAGRDIKILGDIQGPKFRCTLTQDDLPVPLENGEEVSLALAFDEHDLTKRGRITLAPTTEQVAMIRGLEEGMSVLLDDGSIEIKVKMRKPSDEVLCEVVVGGNLKSRKGINVPELQIDASPLTDKDRKDIKFLLTVPGCVDYIALSFVQQGRDIQELLDIFDEHGISRDSRPGIIPKIEKPAALNNIDEILALSDGMMVARGDLGVELGLARVPFAQKALIRKANEAGKFCITATMMMESMISNSVPTRAEVSDVANAIFDGTDAVMLSGETATGHDPALVVEWMGRIIAEAETHADTISPSL